MMSTSHPAPMSSNMDSTGLTRARQWIKESDSIIVTAGAGMSGLPDFRSNEGFWKAYSPLDKAGIAFTEIANGDAFVEDPVLSWGFYGHRLVLYREIVPHAGFALLREAAAQKPKGLFIFTSNVDGQFQKAGIDEDRIVECHGSIHHLQCSCDCAGAIWPADKVMPQVDMEHCRLSSLLPLCPYCGTVARPNILMFNDYRWNESRTDDQYDRMRAWLDTVKRPVVIELGAGKVVPSVQRMGEGLGAPLVRIDPYEWHVNGKNRIGLPCGALEGLKRLLE